MNQNRCFKPGNLLKANSFRFTSTAFSCGDFVSYTVNTNICPGDLVVWLRAYNDDWFYGLHSQTGRIVLLCTTSFDMVVS